MCKFIATLVILILFENKQTKLDKILVSTLRAFYCIDV